MGHLSKRPSTNDRGLPIKSPWLGGSGVVDDIGMLLSGDAERCDQCKRTTHVKNLNESHLCPDCRQ